jgi:hypothetical protein
VADSVREPVKTYCSVCNEVIYEDEEYGDHGWEESDLQHDACHAKVEAEKRASRLEFIAQLPELRKSNKLEDRIAVAAHDAREGICRALFDTSSGFLGPWMKP